MTAPRPKRTALLGVLGRALGLVWQASPGYVLASVPIALIQGLLPAVQLYITKLLLDEVVHVIQAQGSQPHALSHLLVLLALQATAGLIGTGLGTLQHYLESMQGERLSNAIQRKILVKASEMGLSSFEDGVFYDQLQRAYQEAGNRPLQIIGQLRNIVQSSITTASFIALLIHLSPWVLLILVASALPGFLVQTRYGHLNYWMLRHRVPEVRKQSYFSYILRTDWLIKELKLFNLEGHFIGHFDTLFKKFFAQTRRLYRQRSWASLSAAILSSLGTLGALLFVALAVVGQRLSVGDFGMYTGVVAQFRGQVSSILSSVGNLYNNALFISNLFEFLALPSAKLDEGKVWSAPIISVEFRHVSFRYPGSERFVLQDVSFSVNRGEALALVGANGAGKTTLIKLLCALYQPTAGQIFFNGQDTSAYSPRSLQRQISATFQDFGHYELTARENVELGRVEDQQGSGFQEAVARAGVQEDLLALPKGYDSQLGRWFEDGVQLSGGQWQKLALARSYFRNASVVVLDEPTSALDAESEFEVYRAVQGEQKHKITVLISHRFSTVRLADRILVLEGGQVTEQGSHEELLAIGGYYQKHFEMQAVGYR